MHTGSVLLFRTFALAKVGSTVTAVSAAALSRQSVAATKSFVPGVDSLHIALLVAVHKYFPIGSRTPVLSFAHSVAAAVALHVASMDDVAHFLAAAPVVKPVVSLHLSLARGPAHLASAEAYQALFVIASIMCVDAFLHLVLVPADSVSQTALVREEKPNNVPLCVAATPVVAFLQCVALFKDLQTALSVEVQAHSLPASFKNPLVGSLHVAALPVSPVDAPAV